MSTSLRDTAPPKRSPLPPSCLPRGLSREQAAAYIGIGVTLFEQMVADGRMPKPKPINGRRVWDIRKLDAAFEALPDIDGQAEDVWGDLRV